jgi:hypothetical protein
LHKLAYADLRQRFELTFQAAVRCIAKVADAFKVNRKIAPRFRKDAAQPYDDRIETVSLWTVSGRLKARFTAGEQQKALLTYRKG